MEKEQKKKKKKKKSHIPLRMNLMFFVVFLLFALLILRLGVVQIVHGEDAKRTLERTDDVTVSTGVPRGIIYDRNYDLVVGNQSKRAITYTPSKNPKQEEMLETAEKLAKIITMDTKKITLRDKQDFWLMINKDEGLEKVSLKEAEDLTTSEVDSLRRERITEEELNSLTEEDLQVLAIYREFSSGYALVPQIVKNEDVKIEEFATVNEHLNELPGVDTTMDWVRDYPFNSTLRSLLGNLTNGLPRESLEYYESRGYSRNDRVGRSYIELQYEDILSGQKEKVKNVTRKGSVLETEVIREGKAGNSLVLSVDMELQAAIDQIIEEEIRAAKAFPGTYLLDKAFVTVMNPKTGEVLAMSGKQYVYDEEENKYVFNDYSTGNITAAYVPGSVVKGATVLSGYMTGVISKGQTLIDTPLIINNGQSVFSSLFNQGGGSISLTDSMALIRSSNVYMYRIALMMGDGQYRRNQSLIIDKEKAFRLLRYNFNQFGLGVKTGIDLPGEQTGVKGNVATATGGNAFHFAIGQYDTNTPLQLAQYVSTIANGGYRMQPQIVKEIREPSNVNGELGHLIKGFEPKVLNRINASDDEIKHIQNAFRGVFNHPRGTGSNYFKNKPYDPAGKTGTADTYEIDKNGKSVRVWNSSLIAYAPSTNPEIAISIVIPAAYTYDQKDHRMNQKIGTRVFDAYFDLKEKRAKDAGTEEQDE